MAYKRVASIKSITAPIGGLNARDGISEMSEKDAVVMKNMFPTPTDVRIRSGMTAHLTGISGLVETIIPYSSGTTHKIFAAAGDKIYDATTAGVAGAAAVSSMTNARWQYINMGTAGGNYMLAVNGSDKMRIYTGSAWDYDGGGTYTVTGVNTANCIHINNFKNRVWFIEKNKLSAWYLPVSSIAGAAAELNLNSIFKLGGYLVAMANWTIDNTSGIDDYAAFITSEGECAIYQGTDPTSSTTWSLKGTFRVGKPIGRRCFIKAGADVILLSTDGAFPLSKSLLTDRTQKQAAITDKITNLISGDITAYKDNFGWQAIIYPFGNKLILNVPSAEGVTSHQYVMNMISGAWTKFEGWNAFCFEESDDSLYYGGDGTVYKCDTGTDDNGSNIEADCQQSYSYFNQKGVIKRFLQARPIFLSDGDIYPSIRMNVDYELEDTISPPSFSGTSGSEWDISDWDVSDWGGNDSIFKNWQSISGVGYAGGIRIRTSTKGISYRWQSTDISFESGGMF